jgi:hypothetical protein
MSLRLNNIAEFDALQKRMTGKPLETSIPEFNRPPANKYHNVICEADKIKFPSKKHRAHYLLLRSMQQAGEIKWFLREVPFDLPGHYETGRVVRHYIDFMLCLPDDRFRYQEVKGRDLAMGKLKRVQVEEIYKIRIEVI